MKKLKVTFVLFIFIFATLSILYLIFQAEKIERTTIAPLTDRIGFIIYSTNKNIEDKDKIVKLLKYANATLQEAGYEGVMINNGKPCSPDEARKNIEKKIKGGLKYILLDVNMSNLVVNKDTVLLRVDKNNGQKYIDNIDFVETIKNSLEGKGFKVNVIEDYKFNNNQDLGYRALKIDISSNNTLDEGKEAISKIIEVIIK
ncbi:hypothetical protein Q428_00165 [Fervidicella metallireducens AeB]|uniref:Uncharacterized protein n=1 Tax=Fervidicella metallireducens AeB TaxID=1403537 RepID=A0A017RYK0_9CLOT|nr:hypothetical protein [Fervidicella metallireducens]EYE89858.1 hypothetical protein Q428_00165 [Fervidicella metallireducens AeB]